jgi:hypothetical protein
MIHFIQIYLTHLFLRGESVMKCLRVNQVSDVAFFNGIEKNETVRRSIRN